jgi:uncharacterized protein (TIGR02217 family)
MAYLNAYLDECAAFGWTGGPEFKTRIRVLTNGRERRNADWAQGRHRYTLPFMNIGEEQYRAIRQMFETCRGMLHTFRYRDLLDYHADNEEFGIGTGATAEYQLSKLSQIDGVIYQREVYALAVMPVITSNHAPIVPSAVDLDRGKVVINATAGHVLRWTGNFDVWVRFNHDALPFSIDDRRGGGDYARNGQVELIEDAPPPEASS